MRKIRFGRTEQWIPAVSVGTWSYGGAALVAGEEVGWSGHRDEAATAALELAFERGLDHWDTADVYGDGRSEKLIGGLWDRVPREKVFLATKIGYDPGGYEHPYDRRFLAERLDRSLTNLRTDRVDLYYLHRCDFGPEDRYLEEAGEALERAREAGKIRFTGLSDWDATKLVRYARQLDPDVIQPYRNVVDDAWISSGLAAWADERDAGVAFFSPLKHGLLLGKYDEPRTFEPGDTRNRVPEFQDPDALAHYRRCRDAIRRRFADQEEPVLHALVGALLEDAPTGCVLMGLRNPEQVRQAAAAGSALGEEGARWVRDLYRR